MRLGARVRLFGGMLLRETPGLQMAPVVVVHSGFLYGAATPAPLSVPSEVSLLADGTLRGSLQSMPPKSLALR